MVDAAKTGMPALGSCLLDDQDVVAYLDALGAHPPDFPTNRTATSEFRAEIVALDDGLFDDEGAAAPHIPSLFPAHEDESPLAAPRSTAGDTPHIGLFGAAAFLLGMTLLGAAAAALVFHASVSQIVGW